MKRMLTVFYVITIIAGNNFSTLAQKAEDTLTSGVYLTAEDFKNGTLNYAADCKIKKNKIIIKKNTINVTRGKEVHKLDKDIYGYQPCTGKTFRMYKGKAYVIFNPKEQILLYWYLRPTAGKIPGKIEYHFSKDYRSELIPLTLLNLKNAYPDNHKFHDLLDANFQEDTQLIQYNEFYKEYKVNHLLEDSLK